jgi:hypothetical protein
MRILWMCALVLLAGCATADPAPQRTPGRATPPEATAAGPSTTSPSAPQETRGTTDSGSRYLPMGPLGALTVETMPPRPPAGEAPAPSPAPAASADASLPAPPGGGLSSSSDLPPPLIR